MTIPERLHQVFKQSTGKIPITVLYAITHNMQLINQIADRYNHKPMYKPRSNVIVGFGDHSQSYYWVTNSLLDQGWNYECKCK